MPNEYFFKIMHQANGNKMYGAYVSQLRGFIEKYVKLSGTYWTAEFVLKKFMVDQLDNKCPIKLLINLHEGRETDLYKLSSIADQ